MKNVLYALVVAAALMPLPASANPTGAPLLTFPVQPCRFMDTRVAQEPIQPNTGIDAFVRGSVLLPSTGALRSDCQVPASAEAVMVNLTVVQPTGSGYLQVNGTGTAHGPNGAYSRLNFMAGQTGANEILVSLCNAILYPAAHAPCLFDNAGRFADFQIVNHSSGTVHVVGDVVGYLERPEIIVSH